MGENSKIEWTERLWQKVERRNESECWPWTGAKLGKTGYGSFFVGTDGVRHTTAHRAAYASVFGWPPSELQIDHTCRNRCCMNPAHLEAVTNRENTLRGMRGRLKTTCDNGHPFTTESTGRTVQGRRFCILCRRIREKRRVRDAAFWRVYRQKRAEARDGS